MRLSVLFALAGIFGILSLAAPKMLQAQTATGPEQDCFAALTVTRPVIIHQLSYSGAGTNLTDISANIGCISTSELNSVWYRVVAGANGTLAFTITPLNDADDYNFVAFRAQSGTTGFQSCQGTTSSADRIVACNFSPGSGLTGANTTQRMSFPNNFANSISVSANDVILICVSNRTGLSGFTFDFSASSPNVIPTTTSAPAPTLGVKAVQTQMATGCSSPSQLAVTFSQPVIRGSVQPSSFVIQNADGSRTFTVTAVACTGCPSENTGTPTFTLNISPAITEPGVYRLSTSNTASAVIARDLSGAPVVTSPIQFVVNIGTRIPTLQVDNRTPLSTPQTAGFCLAQSVRLTAEDAGTGGTYQWLREEGGMLREIAQQTNRTLNIFGRYSGDDTPSGDSVIVQVGQTTRFVVRITDGNGCQRLSSTADVNVSGGAQATITAGTEVFPSSRVARDIFACRNLGVTLEAQSGFRSYLWYANGRPVDTARSRFFFVRENGSYTVETVDATGCRNRPATVNLLPFDSPTPTVSGPDVNCPDPTTGRITNRITLTGSTDAAYTSYEWLDSLGRVISTGTSSNTISVLTGKFTYRVRTANGCVVTVDKTVRAGEFQAAPPIIPNETLGAIPLCPGGSVLLQATKEFVSYIWSRNGVVIDGATRRTYTATQAGLYTVQGVGADGCITAPSNPPARIEGTNIALPRILPAGGVLQFCKGSSIPLSVDGGDNFEWTYRASAGAPLEFLPTTRQITADKEGIYSVRVTFNSPGLAGCSVSSTATLVAVNNPDPIFENPASDSTFCQGSSLTLRIQQTFDSYQWSRNGTAIPGATMRTLTVTASGDYTVRVTAFGGCIGTSATRRVTELPTPNVPMISSNNDFLVCPNGSTDIFVSNVQAGVTYQWFREGQAITGATGPRLTVTQRGNYLVEARNPNGCASRPPSPSLVDTTALPTPPILPRTLVICPNASTNADAGAGFSGYQWLKDGVVLMGETSRTYAIRSGGRYSVRVTNTRGCINTSADIVVTQTAVTVTIATIDGGVRFQASSTPAPQRFQWLRNGVNIPGAIESIFAPQLEGSYNVRVTDINGCTDSARSPREFRLPIFRPPVVTCGTVAGVAVPCPTPQDSSRGGGGINTPNAVAAPGDTIAFRFTLASYGTLSPGARIAGDLCFNATLLEPFPPLGAGTISSGIRCIPVTFTLPANISDSLLSAVFRAALGNDSITAVRLQNVRLLPEGGAPLPNSVGSFRLTNISYAGGARLIGPPPTMRLLPTAQNPTSDVAVVGYTLSNVGAADAATPVLPVAITMTDVFGRTVKTSDVQYLIGASGELRMNVSDLAPGVYFMVVRSKQAVSVQRIHVVR